MESNTCLTKEILLLCASAALYVVILKVIIWDAHDIVLNKSDQTEGSARKTKGSNLDYFSSLCCCNVASR